MADIRPFRAYRPLPGEAMQVSARSADRYTAAEKRFVMIRNPVSFLHVIYPDFSDGYFTPPGSPDRLRKTKNAFSRFIKNGIFFRDIRPNFYVYRMEKGGASSTGVIGCASITDYRKKIIRPHEQTMRERETKLMEYLKVVDIHAEPVCITYPFNFRIAGLLEKITRENSEYDFTTADSVRHRLWLVGHLERIKLLQHHFSAVPSMYIADGHHRIASSVLLEKYYRKRGLWKKKGGYNYFMAFFISDREVNISSFDRIVKAGVNHSDVLRFLEPSFNIRKKWMPYYPGQTAVFGMRLDNKWYSLRPKEKPSWLMPDAHVLNEKILKPLFGITDLRNDRRIAYCPSSETLWNCPEGHAADNIVFTLYPPSVEQIMEVAGAGGDFPPKTTYVEPRMRSGLIIYSLDDEL